VSSRTVVAVTVGELPSDQVGDFINHVVDQLRREVLARPRLSATERAQFEREASNLQVQRAKILRGARDRQKDAAQRAVASALCLSFYHGGGSQILREMKRDFRSKQTEPARAQRRDRGLAYKEIVDAEAEKWTASPKFANKPGTIAHTIYASVASKVEQLPNKPKWWPPKPAVGSVKAETEKEVRVRRIEAIRKHIERKRHADH
jgi:hypothetical protein